MTLKKLQEHCIYFKIFINEILFNYSTKFNKQAIKLLVNWNLKIIKPQQIIVVINK